MAFVASVCGLEPTDLEFWCLWYIHVKWCVVTSTVLVLTVGTVGPYCPLEDPVVHVGVFVDGYCGYVLDTVDAVHVDMVVLVDGYCGIICASTLVVDGRLVKFITPHREGRRGEAIVHV